MANLNTEQAAALARLLPDHPGPLSIENGPGGRRYVDFPREGLRYALNINGGEAARDLFPTATSSGMPYSPNGMAGDPIPES